MDGHTSDHNNVLKAVARDRLAPLGLVQKGRSRTWLDDQGWYLTVVEFLPSSWSKGSYLNVGAMWLWNAKPHLSFDYGYRVAEFEPADQGDWAADAARLATLAERRVHELRRELTDVRAAADVLRRSAGGRPGWPAFDAAIACALAGRTDEAQRFMDAVLASEDDREWWVEAQARMRELRALLSDPSRFRSAIAAEIGRARELHKLRRIDSEAVLQRAAP